MRKGIIIYFSPLTNTHLVNDDLLSLEAVLFLLLVALLLRLILAHLLLNVITHRNKSLLLTGVTHLSRNRLAVLVVHILLSFLWP